MKKESQSLILKNSFISLKAKLEKSVYIRLRLFPPSLLPLNGFSDTKSNE